MSARRVREEEDRYDQLFVEIKRALEAMSLFHILASLAIAAVAIRVCISAFLL